MNRSNFSYVLVFVFMVACKIGEEPTEQEIAEGKLSFTWSVANTGSVILDGVDVTSFYESFSITFSIGSYTTRNANGLFKASGTWEWPDQSASRVRLDDGKVLSVRTLSETTLDFSFSHVGTGGVASNISGDYRFSLSR